jgi:hypothetical protein
MFAKGKIINYFKIDKNICGGIGHENVSKRIVV